MEISANAATIIVAMIGALATTVAAYARWAAHRGQGESQQLLKYTDHLEAEIERLQNRIEYEHGKKEIWKEAHKQCADDFHDATGRADHYRGFITDEEVRKSKDAESD